MLQGIIFFMFTDVLPTGNIYKSIQIVKNAEFHKEIKFFTLGIGAFNIPVLLKYTKRVMNLSDVDF